MNQLKGKQTAEVAQQTRRKILEAAGQQFAANGFLATSLRHIADAAGTTHGLIRHHFGTKEDLWREVVDDFIDRVEARQLPLLERADEEEAITLIKAVATAFMRQSADMPEIGALILKDCSEPGPRLDYLMARMMPAHQAITPIFEAAKASGHLKHHDADSFFVFLLMVGSLPFSLAPVTNQFLQMDIQSKEGIEIHINRVLTTLFGETE